VGAPGWCPGERISCRPLLSEVRGGQGPTLYPVTHSLDRDVQNLGRLGHGLKRRMVIDWPLAPLCLSLLRPYAVVGRRSKATRKLLRGILRALRGLLTSLVRLRLRVTVVESR
jgi:hypothetical protein